MSAALYKKKTTTTTTTVEFACKLLFLGRSTEQKLWSIGEETRTPIHLGWPRCELNSKLDFKKRDEVSTVKSQTEQNTLENHIARHTQTRLRSEMHWKMPLYLDFRSYFEATGPNCFNVFWKVLLQSMFLAKIISWRPKRAKKAVSWNVVATSLLGNLGYQTKRKKDLWQKQNCSGAACLQWHHAAELNWDAVMTVARQVRIPNQ